MFSIPGAKEISIDDVPTLDEATGVLLPCLRVLPFLSLVPFYFVFHAYLCSILLHDYPCCYLVLLSFPFYLASVLYLYGVWFPIGLLFRFVCVKGSSGRSFLSYGFLRGLGYAIS